MGFDATDEGLQWRLTSDVPDLARTWTRASVAEALAQMDWELDDIEHALVHPGGTKVLDAVGARHGLGLLATSSGPVMSCVTTATSAA